MYAGCADASGFVRYFNISATRVHKNDTIVMRCGATLEEAQDGGSHSLIIQIRKWFRGCRMQWLLTSNEDVEIASDRYQTKLNRTDMIQEVEFTIKSKRLRLPVLYRERKCAEN